MSSIRFSFFISNSQDNSTCQLNYIDLTIYYSKHAINLQRPDYYFNNNNQLKGFPYIT